MKKLSLLIGGVMFSGFFMAQSINSERPVTIEGQTTIGGIVLGQKLAPAVRFRYFVAEKWALHATFGYFGKSTTNNFYQFESNNSGEKGTYMTKNSAWNLAIGAEYHVAGTERVSPYVSLDLIYGAGKGIVDANNANSSSYVANYTRDTETPIKRFGAALMGGLDYNISSSFYLGGEVGVQMSSVTYGPGETETVSGGVTTNVKSNEVKAGFTSDLVGALRLGFRF